MTPVNIIALRIAAQSDYVATLREIHASNPTPFSAGQIVAAERRLGAMRRVCRRLRRSAETVRGLTEVSHV